MGQAKLPVSCESCPTRGPRKSRATKAGWLRVSWGGQDKPRWLCPECRVPYEEEREAERKERAKASAQRLEQAAFGRHLRHLAAIAALGGMPPR